MRNLEAFLAANPADSFLTGCILGRVEDEGNSRSTIDYFAGELAKAGSDGLVTVATSITDQGILDEQEYLAHLAVLTKPEMGAIVWGSLVPEIRKSLSDNIFDSGIVIERINALTSKALVPPLLLPENSIERIPPLKQHEMKKTYALDPSYSLFYRQPFHLPNAIRGILTNLNFFSSKEAMGVVEEWKPRAELLSYCDPFVLYNNNDTSQIDTFLGEERSKERLRQVVGQQVDELLKEFE